MKSLDLYLPKESYSTIYTINYNALSLSGITTLFFDLDNTIVDYQILDMPLEVESHLKDLSKSFKIMIVSNNSKKRVKRFIGSRYPYLARSGKPLIKGLIKAEKMIDSIPSEIALIGDQITTDILGANKRQYVSILVKPINTKTDNIFTRMSRKVAHSKIKKIKKVYPDVYKVKIEDYV
jgi:HAD superfamily phosphatase (TIGR01668 family)